MLLLTTVPRGMDVVNLAVNHIDTGFNQDIDELVDTCGISRNRTGREDNRVAWLELHLTVGTVGDAREGAIGSP